MGTIIMELKMSYIVVESELFWLGCNVLHHIYDATHATWPLALTTCKYNELQC
jgi:hypothetical protein